MAERVMRELGMIFRTYYHDKHNKWIEYIKTTEDLLNTNVHEPTGFTPAE